MISVVIPTYNRAKLIARSIESVLNQTYKDIEIIVVDDGSEDNTEEIVLNIKDDRIKFFRMKCNQGACAARNKGISMATGEYVAFQDSDDEWLPEKLERQMEEIEKADADFCFCKMKVIDTISAKSFFIPRSDLLNKLTLETLLQENFISTQMLLVKKSCFNNIKFDINLPRFQDWDLIINLMSHYKMTYVDSVLVNQYIQNDSITKSVEKYIKATDILFQKHEKLYKKYKKIYAIRLNNVVRFCNYNGLNAKRFLKKLIKIQPNIKNLIKYAFYKIKLLQLIYILKRSRNCDS